MNKGVFIVGTGTDVGKTFVSALLVKRMNDMGKTAYFKAAMSGNKRDNGGNLVPGDALYVKTISGISQSLNSMCPYVYEQAVSPHLASKYEDNPVSMDTIENNFKVLVSEYDYIIVEGSGGIVCPIRFDEEKIFLEDLVSRLDLSCIIVADTVVGTINHTVLTAEYMKSKNIDIKGIIFNRYDPSNPVHIDNVKMCEYLTGLRVLGYVKDYDSNIEISDNLLDYIFD